MHGVKALYATIDLGFHTVLNQLLPNGLNAFSQRMFPSFTLCFHCFLQLFVAQRIHVAEGEVFQLAAHLSHSQAMCDGRVNIESLSRDLLLAVRRKMRQSPHVVQAVRELDQHHADVVHHGQHHLAHVLRLALFFAGKLDLVDLGDPIHNTHHLLAELLQDVFASGLGVFDGIVQQTRGDSDGIQLHLRKDLCHLQRMHQIGLTGGASLPGMVLKRVRIGFLDYFEVVGGPVGAHGVHQVTELCDRQYIRRDLLAQGRHVLL